MKRLARLGALLTLAGAALTATAGTDGSRRAPDDDLPENPNAVWTIASVPDGLTPGDHNQLSSVELAQRHADQVSDAMHKTFDSIADPSGAKTFKEMFSGQPDPDGLLLKADDLGYRRGIKFAQRCISRANALIAQQKQIAAEVGYVDKNVMYQAGAALVRCKQNLATWSQLVKR